MRKPKQCINSECKNIMYVIPNQLHMCIQCDACVKKMLIRVGVRNSER